MRLLAFTLALAAAPALADHDRAGDFTHYILALSWEPTWCALEGEARGAEECTWGRGFVLHGLWPQREQGWPAFCLTTERDPSRRETAGMADLIAPGLAWHQWKKHGRCAGLPATDYFALMRRAVERVAVPEPLRRLSEDISLPPRVLEEAFTEANPGLAPEGITVACEAGHVQEVRICLTKDLDFRPCAPDARQDCPLPLAKMDRP
ncbi:ribonuclease T2 family protein [Cereibacter johrii]|uniref:Ribonuclease T2 n=1 Tax=Cereibacter johrii TaxID=445629 RepID=A0ABX5J7M5_9RHOB|nr:ribonuclease T2 [Cereibacter johrii]ODM41624.1 ribonuclease T [Cereibacter johrii]PTM79181.1 ribonuclease T2 [Cereibacter johrii]